MILILVSIVCTSFTCYVLLFKTERALKVWTAANQIGLLAAVCLTVAANSKGPTPIQAEMLKMNARLARDVTERM